MRTALVIALVVLRAGADARSTQAAPAFDSTSQRARAIAARAVGARGAPTLVHFEGGRMDYAPAGACLTEAQVQQSLAEVESNLARLRQAGVIPQKPTSTTHPLLEFPLRAAAHLDDPGFYYLFAYFDHAPSFGQLLDYNCGRRTHNAGDGAHSGIDWNLWPFDWNKMDDDDVEVVAAAPGVVTLRREGFADRSCPGAATPDWNGIVLRHDDGSLAYYVHFKRGSVTTKGLGQRIETGEYLGVVGSSGPSISPHLHLHIFDNSSPRNYVDPFAGPCNSLNAESWWADQPPYEQPGINKISTHRGLVGWTPCGLPDDPQLEDEFAAGATVTFYVFGRDASPGDPYDFEILDPDGKLAFLWKHDFDQAGFRDNYHLSWQWTFPADWQPGRYTYRLTHFEKIYEHTFTLGTEVPVLLQDFRATGEPEGVRLAWEVVDEEPFVGFRLTRSVAGTSDITLLGAGLLHPEIRTYLDRNVRAGRTYTYRLSLVRDDDSLVEAPPVTTSVPAPRFELEPNQPNPFNPRTSIAFALDRSERIELSVFDMRGEHVITLVDRVLPAGRHEAAWDGRDAHGRSLASGVYLYRLLTPTRSIARRMTLLR